MRVKRRRRRALLAALAAVYLGVFAWLVSPLWRPAKAITSQPTRALPVKAEGAVGIAGLDASKALPESLPGSNTGTVATAETGGEEAVSETVTETAESTPESSEASTSSPAPSSESSQPQETIISSEG